MRVLVRSLLLLMIFGFTNCKTKKAAQDELLASPSGDIEVTFSLNDSGKAVYRVDYKNKPVILNSVLGFDFTDMVTLDRGLEILGTEKASFNEPWEMPWGEQLTVYDHHNMMRVFLKESSPPERKFNIIFKAFDDGIGFRFEFPEQEGWKQAHIKEEHTEFRLNDDHLCWWIPGDWDIYEHLYNTTPFTEIDAISKRDHPALAQTYIPNNAVNTPLTMKTPDGIYLSFHEANLSDYAGMTLGINKDSLAMKSILVGSDNTEYKVKRELPFNTPWRTIQITDRAASLIESRMILNLNEPCRIEDISWFKPMKYAGIWWELHLGKTSWDYESGNHGATTLHTKEMMDFASENMIGGLLVEGWNTGWENWFGSEHQGGDFDFVTCYPDYDIEEVVRYGKEKGVDLIMHHETGAAVLNYEKHLDTAFSLMKRLGIHVVKSGYVQTILPKGEYHHGQFMVNHYRRVIETAAKYDVAVNVHEPIKATGIRRTWPNAISREGLRGQEFNAWSPDGGNPPEHLSIIAFTRMLAGPIDFTPGIFNIKLEPYKSDNQVNTTLAHQLALYVVLYSPVQMVPDLPEHYEGHPALQFIRDVGVDWHQSKALQGEPGDFIVMAREERETGNWFVGGISDENSREISLPFGFLSDKHQYKATIYKDGMDAHWDNNPTSILMEEIQVGFEDKISLKLAAGGGFAISLEKL